MNQTSMSTHAQGVASPSCTAFCAKQRVIFTLVFPQAQRRALQARSAIFDPSRAIRKGSSQLHRSEATLDDIPGCWQGAPRSTLS